MVHLIRKYQQSLMLLVTTFVIISFVWFYNGQRSNRAGIDSVAVIYGQNVTMAQYQREARKFSLCQPLGIFEFWMTLIGNEARSETQAVDSFVWNTIVLRHESEQLGIQPTEDEIVEAIKALPPFQTNGSYDSKKYSDFLQRLLANGLTDGHVAELIRDELCLRKIRTLLGSTVSASPGEIRSAFERESRKSEASYVRFQNEDFAKSVEISDADIQKLFEERKDSLKTDELRTVRLVSFVLGETEKSLTGKDKAAALSKLGERALEFTVAMTEKDAKLDAVAEKFGIKVQETEAFSPGKLPEPLLQCPQGAQAAFQLTMEQPHSDVVTGDNGYYILQLKEITAPKPLTLEEAKPKLADQLKDERTRETLSLKVAETRSKLTEALKAGKPFAAAATELGLKPESIPAFSMAEPPKSEQPEIRSIANRAFDLAEGQLSDPIQLPNGTALLHVDKRLPADEEKFEQGKALLSENLARSKQSAALELWLKERRAVAQVNPGRS
jgi:peptidyl-prolyl cis-trans isomerase D